MQNYNTYKEYFSEDLLESVKTLNTFSNKEIINTNLDSKSLANMFSMDETTVQGILAMSTKEALSPAQFVNILLSSNMITNEEQMLKLNMINGIMQSANNDISYTYTELSSFINADSSKIKLIYAIVLL